MIAITIECVMIAIMASGIGRFQSNCQENPGMARDNEDNCKRVTVAIAISEISRLPRELKIVKEVCVRVYSCPVRSGLP